MPAAEQTIPRRVGIVAGGGTLPFAVAHSIKARGDVPILFAIDGYCDRSLTSNWQHHWVRIGQLGRFVELARTERCRDIVCVGSLIRPALSDLRLDWQTIRAMPAVIAAFRGGDDHLLTGVARIFEKHGLNFVGILDVAPELTLPTGSITRRSPDNAALRDIEKGRAVLTALSRFDVGQAAIVIDDHVVSLEDIEGTDALLARIARLRAERRLRAPTGRGVLVKMPKAGQDFRFDLPALGPQTIEGLVAAGLAGVAAIAQQTLLAEPDSIVTAADRAGLFVTGLSA